MSKLSPDELEKQLNPRVTVPDFQTYLDRSAKASEAARASLSAIRDVRYGPRPRQLLDIYPAEDPRAPLVIFVHGGFWRALSKEAFAGLAGSLRPKGISTVLIGYDLCPAVTLDELVAEIIEAIAFCGSNLRTHGIEPRRVVLAGTSAGAHLIAMALLSRDFPHVDAACLVSGVYDVEPVVQISVGAAIGLDADSARRNSPALHVRRLGIPLLIAVGETESPEWRRQSEDFAKRCTEAGNDVRYLGLPGAHHFSTGIAIPGSMLNDALVFLAISPSAVRPPAGRSE
jgi:arylformamidase